jgi:hypothetical protein
VKVRITDVCHIDQSMFMGVLHKSEVRRFIRDTYCDVLFAATRFIEQCSIERGIPDQALDAEGMYFNWDRGEIDATVTLPLKLKFTVVENRLQITEIDFDN